MEGKQAKSQNKVSFSQEIVLLRFLPLASLCGKTVAYTIRFFYQKSAYLFVLRRFAAALSDQNVWVMNVVPVHAPDTLPIIYERGLAGIYHDWCESFGTYPRSYDLLHADHMFSRLKSRLN